MQRGSKLTPKGAKIVAALERFRDAIKSGTPIEQRYTVRRVRLDLTPRTFGSDEVKEIRAMIGVSQPIFGQFLGVDVKTVRSWEQGRRTPSPMACRFLEEIQASPEHWRSRLDAVLGASDRVGTSSSRLACHPPAGALFLGILPFPGVVTGFLPARPWSETRRPDPLVRIGVNSRLQGMSFFPTRAMIASG